MLVTCDEGRLLMEMVQCIRPPTRPNNNSNVAHDNHTQCVLQLLFNLYKPKANIWYIM